MKREPESVGERNLWEASSLLLDRSPSIFRFHTVVEKHPTPEAEQSHLNGPSVAKAMHIEGPSPWSLEAIYKFQQWQRA
nr:hypothetical protein CFP56_32889 [Quercus suber]